jgi:LysM repeat protein/3D (Asp-Asp-Asp) domain-containing protein
MTKTITTYEKSAKLIVQRSLPKPPKKSSIKIISVEDMIEKHIEVLEPTRYTRDEYIEEPTSKVEVVEENTTTPIEIVQEELKIEEKPDYPLYKVQKGDSLHLIARKFDMTISELMKYNSIEDKSKIKLGQKITIPVTTKEFNDLKRKYKKKLEAKKRKRLALIKKRKLAKAKRARELRRKQRLMHKLYPTNKKHLKYGINRKRFKRKLRIQATAYTSHRRQTDKTPFLAAWNNRLRPGMKAIAVSRDLIRKYGITNGKRVKISGLSGTYVVKDKMNKRFRKRIDIYMGLNRRKALRWGRRSVTIYW